MDTLRLWIGSGLAAFLILTSTWLRLRADEQLNRSGAGTDMPVTSASVVEAKAPSAVQDAGEEPAIAPLASGPAYRPYVSTLQTAYNSEQFPAANTPEQSVIQSAELPLSGGSGAEFSVEEQAGLLLPPQQNSAFATDFGMRGPAAIMEANNVEGNVPSIQDYVYTRIMGSQNNTANALITSVTINTDSLSALQADDVSIGNSMVVLSESTEDSPEPLGQTIETTVEVEPVQQEGSQPGIPQPIINDSPEEL